MFLEQQRYWIDLLNARRGFADESAIERVVPARHLDFSDPPGWSRTRAFNFFLNNLDAIRASHHALEDGERMELDLLNHVLGETRLRLVDHGRLATLKQRRRVREAAGERLDSLLALSPTRSVNPGTAFLRHAVERAVFYFAQYADSRYADNAYPDASAGKFQVKACLRPGCGVLFIRTPETFLYCGDDCARRDR